VVKKCFYEKIKEKKKNRQDPFTVSVELKSSPITHPVYP